MHISNKVVFQQLLSIFLYQCSVIRLLTHDLQKEIWGIRDLQVHYLYKVSRTGDGILGEYGTERVRGVQEKIMTGQELEVLKEQNYEKLRGNWYTMLISIYQLKSVSSDFRAF